jgi:hypothetical protein
VCVGGGGGALERVGVNKAREGGGMKDALSVSGKKQRRDIHVWYLCACGGGGGGCGSDSVCVSEGGVTTSADVLVAAIAFLSVDRLAPGKFASICSRMAILSLIVDEAF